jgi:RNA recognition motif-containing protein
MLGGKIWEDSTLADWEQDDYRLFVGDLGNEVNEDMLFKAFNKYSSLIKTHVVRDKRTGKTKGFGFLSFKDSDDYVKAMREMNGKYVGSRPISLKKSNVKETMATKDGIQRQKELAALAGNKV